jgi:hypothetical protein
MHAMHYPSAGQSYSPWLGSGRPVDLNSSDKQKRERRP